MKIIKNAENITQSFNKFLGQTVDVIEDFEIKPGPVVTRKAVKNPYSSLIMTMRNVAAFNHGGDIDKFIGDAVLIIIVIGRPPGSSGLWRQNAYPVSLCQRIKIPLT